MTKSFDVFLSHNTKDKPAVRELAEALCARGLKVWLDEWELVPGRPWQEALEEVIETTKAAAVLVGKDGLGPWQDAEMRGCLSEFVNRKLPVIPVLLPGGPEVPKLPFFLARFTWVDLKGGLTEEGIDRLHWGITGKRPDRSNRPSIPIAAQEAAVATAQAPPASAKVKPAPSEVEAPTVFTKERTDLEARVLRGVSPEASFPATVRHVLVTGAGFEIPVVRGGFGMPPIRDILKEMKPALEMGWFPPSPTSDEAFPIPTNGIWTATAARTAGLKAIAQEADLDRYWDFLLEQELQDILAGAGGLSAAECDKRKVQARERERLLREAFRRALRRHDQGFMSQSLDAARMPLHAWLTTNCTQFADRAISLCEDAQETSRPWCIISTAAEARTLAREYVVSANVPDARYLFKLHGDIAHLQTMAVAGHDKDLFSPLSMPVENLYQVYTAAESFLIESFRLAQPTLVVWHIVGHGLQDRRLSDLLARVWFHRKCDQVFVIVNPQAEKPEKHLRDRLEEISPGESPSIHSCTLSAAAYMARLYQLLRGNHDDPREIQTAHDLEHWLA